MAANMTRRLKMAFTLSLVCVPVSLVYEFIAWGRISFVGVFVGLLLVIPPALLEESAFDEWMMRLPSLAAVLAKSFTYVASLLVAFVFAGLVVGYLSGLTWEDFSDAWSGTNAARNYYIPAATAFVLYVVILFVRQFNRLLGPGVLLGHILSTAQALAGRDVATTPTLQGASADQATGRQPPRVKVFVSYRRADSEYAADRINERLSAHFGDSRIVYDIDSIPYGQDFRSYVTEEIKECGVFLAIIGKHWLDARVEHGPEEGARRLDQPDDVVRMEIEAASASQSQVIPVVVGGAALPERRDLPESLRWLLDRNAAELPSGRPFVAHLDRLVEEIETIVGRPKRWGRLLRRLR